jgi:hypothetical protein
MEDSLDRVASDNPALTAPAIPRARSRSDGKIKAPRGGCDPQTPNSSSIKLTKYDVSTLISKRHVSVQWSGLETEGPFMRTENVFHVDSETETIVESI